MLKHTEAFDCPRCSIGHCQPGQITYTRVYHDQMLVLPNTDVFICDVCGYWEFEAQAIQQIQSVEFRTSEKRSPTLSKVPPERDIIDPSELKPTHRPKS